MEKQIIEYKGKNKKPQIILFWGLIIFGAVVLAAHSLSFAQANKKTLEEELAEIDQEITLTKEVMLSLNLTNNELRETQIPAKEKEKEEVERELALIENELAQLRMKRDKNSADWNDYNEQIKQREERKNILLGK